MPNANDAVASSKGDRYLPTHHIVAESRPLQLTAPAPPRDETCSTAATGPCRTIAKLRIIRRLHIYAKRKADTSTSLESSGPSYTPYCGGESTSTAIAPAWPHQTTSSTTATQP